MTTPLSPEAIARVQVAIEDQLHDYLRMWLETAFYVALDLAQGDPDDIEAIQRARNGVLCALANLPEDVDPSDLLVTLSVVFSALDREAAYPLDADVQAFIAHARPR
jgi:hypothetical protein